MTSRDSLADGIAALTAAVHDFDRTVAANTDDLSWEDAALVLRHAREQVALLGAAVGAIEARVIVARREDGVFEECVVPGVGVVSVSRPKQRKAWDHDGLAGHVLDRHLSDLEGEMPTPWEVRDWLLSAGHVDYWRVGVLTDLGIEVDDFCSSTQGPPKVVIVSSDAPAAGL